MAQALDAYGRSEKFTPYKLSFQMSWFFFNNNNEPTHIHG